MERPATVSALSEPRESTAGAWGDVAKWNLNKDSQHKLNSIPLEAQDVVMQQFSPPGGAAPDGKFIMFANSICKRIGGKGGDKGKGKGDRYSPY